MAGKISRYLGGFLHFTACAEFLRNARDYLRQAERKLSANGAVVAVRTLRADYVRNGCKVRSAARTAVIESWVKWVHD